MKSQKRHKLRKTTQDNRRNVRIVFIEDILKLHGIMEDNAISKRKKSEIEIRPFN